MLKKFLLLLKISCIYSYNSVAVEINTTDNLTQTSRLRLMDRKSRANLVSFEPLGEHIQLGLDFLLPFLKVPLIRKVDAYGNEPALVNINTAALVSTGLLASSSALMSLLVRKYVLLGREESSAEKHRRSENVLETDLWSLFNNLKFVYTNSSGARIDTSLKGLFGAINENFQKNDIDLSSCLQKAICSRIQLSARHVNEGDSSGLDKIIDGLMGIKWLNHFLRQTSLKDAMEARSNLSSANNQHQDIYCDIKYPLCKWSMPENYLIDIITTYLKFT